VVSHQINKHSIKRDHSPLNAMASEHKVKFRAREVPQSHYERPKEEVNLEKIRYTKSVTQPIGFNLSTQSRSALKVINFCIEIT
jgi:hypothetical protein